MPQCSCQDGLVFYTNPECQLTFGSNSIIACKESATGECRDAVKQWALAYREAPNAADPKCYVEDPNYEVSQGAAERC